MRGGRHAHGDPVVVLAKREGHFDSSFPEVGPPPVLTARGIVMLYNGKDAKSGAYAAGEALFAAETLNELLDADGGTRMTDTVDYELPLGPLGTLAHSMFVRRSLAKIFDFRAHAIVEMMGEGR